MFIPLFIFALFLLNYDIYVFYFYQCIRCYDVCSGRIFYILHFLNITLFRFMGTQKHICEIDRIGNCLKLRA